MAYWMFIVQILLLQLFSYSSSETTFASARELNSQEFIEGAGVFNPSDSIIIKCPIQGDVLWSKSKWKKTKPQLIKASDDKRYIISKETLTIKNLEFADSGIYRCELNAKSYPFFLAVYEISEVKDGIVPLTSYDEEINGIKFTHYKIDRKTSANVSCSCNTGFDPEKIMIMWKGGLYKEQSHKYNISTSMSGNKFTSSLVLLKPDNDPAPYGEYTCICSTISRKSLSKPVYLKTPPIFHEYELSKRSSEGQEVVLLCNVWSYPKLKNGSVEWRFQNSTNLREGLIVKVDPQNPGHVTLTIPKVTQSDRGLYTCHATNEEGSNIAGIMVRVKGKYAAVWPLIGIFIQLIILAIIIIVYETRKKSNPTGETIDDTVRSNNGSRLEHDAGTGERVGDQSDVRQRLVKA